MEMDSRQAIGQSLKAADMVCMSYLGDMNDQELQRRPHAKCNSLYWQLGHLIVSEHKMVSQIASGKMPQLPAGFAEAFASQPDPAAPTFSRDQLFEVYRQQRAATEAALAQTSDDQLDQPSGIHYAPTVGSVFSMQATHWLMHCGQWVIVRRELDKPILI
jgi:hypothetical protein